MLCTGHSDVRLDSARRSTSVSGMPARDLALMIINAIWGLAMIPVRGHLMAVRPTGVRDGSRLMRRKWPVALA
jgi:hypothetical protein